MLRTDQMENEGQKRDASQHDNREEQQLDRRAPAVRLHVNAVVDGDLLSGGHCCDSKTRQHDAASAG